MNTLLEIILTSFIINLILFGGFLYIIRKFTVQALKQIKEAKAVKPSNEVAEQIVIPVLQQEGVSKFKAKVIHRPTAKRLSVINNPEKKVEMDWLKAEIEKNEELKKARQK